MSGDLVFYGFALLTVVSACFVAFSRNVVHAGFSLLFTLFGVAALYAQLGADFLAVAQVIVYIGGILVLVIFAVMMTRIPRGAPRRGLDRMVPAGAFALALFALLYRVITATPWPTAAVAAPEPTTMRLGTALLTDYIFPFEFVSLLLLAAMVGAAILVRERRRSGENGPEAPAADPAGTEEQA